MVAPAQGLLQAAGEIAVRSSQLALAQHELPQPQMDTAQHWTLIDIILIEQQTCLLQHPFGFKQCTTVLQQLRMVQLQIGFQHHASPLPGLAQAGPAQALRKFQIGNQESLLD